MSPFSHPWLLIFALVGLGALYVVLPVVIHAYRRYREPRIVDCPETGERAAVIVDAKRAGFTAAFAEPCLRVKLCSLWPARKDCPQSCLKRA